MKIILLSFVIFSCSNAGKMHVPGRSSNSSLIPDPNRIVSAPSWMKLKVSSDKNRITTKNPLHTKTEQQYAKTEKNVLRPIIHGTIFTIKQPRARNV